MLSIRRPDSDLLAKWHSRKIKAWVEGRIEKKKIDKSRKETLEKDIDDILISKPKDLIGLNLKFSNLFPKKPKKVKGKIKMVTDSRISYIFDYKAFRSNFGYELARKLDVPCCPYCNSNYTTVHETVRINNVDKKFVFPEFDHFYPKSSHPFLALSFYNLIPSCNICNTHFKGLKDPIKIGLFHPYTILKSNHFNFKFYPQNYSSLVGKGLSIKLDISYNADPATNDSIKKSIKFFDIVDTYEKCHSVFVKDIIDKRISYCNEYLNELQTTFKLDFMQSYRILFETYYEDDNLLRRPFSKLKKDIYNDVEITKYLK